MGPGPWYAGLLAGILPVLLLGFLYSVLADRLVFAGWGLLLAAFYTAALRQGMQAGWPAPRLIGALALLLAAGAAAFAGIEATHHEILDLGYRAVLPPAVYVSAATNPLAAGVMAAILAAGGVGALAAGGRGRQADGPQAGGPQADGPQTDGPQAGGPQVGGPQADGGRDPGRQP
ncbi:MAG: hypothetical protein JOZ15_21425 [Acidobacteria bacterium]|nr:hypothetical protein [Acidobacteriota bacterium]